MTLFNINGENLDVLESTSAQIVRKNEIFAFDELEVNRTQAIELPATANNLRLFGLSNDYHNYGVQMRRRIDGVQMQVGSVTYMGVLYLTGYNYEKKVFTAIYLFGELLGLQVLRNAGTLAEIGTDSAAYITWDTSVKTASQGYGAEWDRIRYANTPENGSMSFYAMLENLQRNLPNLPNVEIDERLKEFFVIKGKMNGYNYYLNFSQIINPTGTPGQPTEEYPQSPYNQYNYDSTLFSEVIDYFGFYTSFGGGRQLFWAIAGLEVLTPMTITMPDNMGAGWFLQKGAITGGASDFYGDYWWEDSTPNNPPIIHGTPLAGKQITFASGDRFFIVNINDYVYGSAGGLTLQGWRFNEGNTIPNSFVMRVQGEERFYLRDNLPEISVLDFLKTVAALLGKVLRYNSANNSISFEDVDISTWSRRISLDGKVLERKEMGRTFKDWAHNNLIKTNDGTVYCSYEVDNDYLEAERDLFVIPFDGGSEGWRDPTAAIVVGENDTIAQSITGSDNLNMVELQHNAGVKNLAYNSTRLKVTCKLNSVEMDYIKSETLIEFDGVMWVWVSMQWTDGVAEIELQKIEPTTIQNTIQ